MENVQPRKRGKIIFHITIVLVILAILLTVVFSLGDFYAIATEIENTNLLVFSGAFLFSFISVLLMAIASNTVLRAVCRQMNGAESFLMFTTEPFFNGIAPFGSGSQPFYLYQFRKRNIPLDKPTSVIAVNFMIYQVVVTVFILVVGAIYLQRIVEAVRWLGLLMLLGMIIHIALLVGFILISVSPRFAHLVKYFLRKLGKIKFLAKWSAKTIEKTDRFVAEFQAGVKALVPRKRVFIFAVLLNAAVLVFRFGAIVFVIIAMQHYLPTQYYVYVSVMSALALVTMTWIAIPGGVGGVELVLLPLLAVVLDLPAGQEESVILAIMLMWRFATYYFQMLLGAIGFGAYSIVCRHRKKKLNLDYIEEDMDYGEKD